jgi:tRNA-specific 2-thiouridylase
LDGITPNPCVKCNRTIKFGALFDFAKSIKADFVATGHYAKTDGKFIYEAEDKTKDQSYFLAQVKKEVLPFILFPMSQFKKEDIIKLGESLNEIFKEISEKKESQEICFVENVYTDIIQKHANIDKPGIVLNEEGKEVGIHKGYMHYTIGKRRGFTVNGAHEPHFVKELNPIDNTITVGQKASLTIHEVKINNLNMFIKDKSFIAGVKLRYRSATTPCSVEIINDNEAIITLHEPAYGVAKGQVAVFYEGNKVLGSGWITQTK